jgi:UDP-3-O-[3-hydroxymyristoyl] glucosamine N-acyltransferase
LSLFPGAKISGNVTIGNSVLIGAGATIKEKVQICDDVVIGAGAVVVKSIVEPGVYAGVPAKKIK